MKNEQRNNSVLEIFLSIFNSGSALIVGALMILSIGQMNVDLSIAGVSVVIGTLAYRSAKNRKLGVTQPSIFKNALEILALVLIFFSIAMKRDLERVIVEDPFLNIFIPACLIFAYLKVVFGKTHDKESF